MSRFRQGILGLHVSVADHYQAKEGEAIEQGSPCFGFQSHKLFPVDRTILSDCNVVPFYKNITGPTEQP